MRETLESARQTIARTDALLEMRERPDPVEWAEHALGGVTLEGFQRQIMRSDHHRLCAVICRQGGKSVITGTKAAFEAYTKPGYRIVIVSPSFRQSMLLAVKIESALNHHGIWYNRVKERLTLANGSSVVVLPGDRPDSIRGFTADAVIIDEIGFLRGGGAELIPAIMPMITATNGRLIAISSPNGPSGFLYDFFHQEGVEAIQVKASNIAHFDPKVIREIRGRLSPALASQELDAEWVASSSSVFDADAISRMFAAPDEELETDNEDVFEAESDLAKRFELMQQKQRKRDDTWGFG